MIDEAGEEVNLSGAARFNSQYGGGTNEEIKKVLGTFDDFILTSLSLQTNGMNFLDKKQAERKKILSTFMDIEVFEQLESIAKSDSNEERVMLRQFQKKDSYKELGTMNQRIIEMEKEEDELNTKDKSIDNKLTMYCANPDFETVDKNNGKNIFCMGAIAEIYKKMGGNVIIKGKPDISIYNETTNQINLEKKRTVAIGDSLFHDIQGANNLSLIHI